MTTDSPWNTRYERKAIAILAVGLGLVGLDRFIFNPLFPVMARDLGLDYQGLGLISATLALTWGTASLFAGRLVDRLGYKKVLVPAVIAFSCLVASTGLAGGFVSLTLIRGMMGFAEGGYVPASIVGTIEASKPSRVGLNVGLQQMAQPLVGLGLGPILAVTLLRFMSWRWIFALVALPGLLLAFFAARKLQSALRPTTAAGARAGTLLSALRYRNVVFNTIGMFCWLSCLIVLSAFMPSYLTDYLHMPLASMGLVLSGFGLGSFVGMIALPAISDSVGRKPVMLVALALELILLWWLPNLPAVPGELFVMFFAITFLNAGVVAITVGPLTAESVPRSLAGAATGIVVGLGEIFGGAVAPGISGAVAQHFGIQYILQISLAAILIGFLVAAFGIREPHPEAMAAKGLA